MAQVFLTRGDLDRATLLYQESLLISEQLGDKQGKAASLSEMANVYLRKQDLKQAEGLVTQSLSLAIALGDVALVAFNTIKLGQIAQARGDAQTALSSYREGLAIFEKLGMPGETAQVREMINDLEHGAPAEASSPLQQAIAQARAAAQQGDFLTAIQAQQQAVALARQAGSSQDDLTTLNVMLYNLAIYYGNVERHAEAVEALEEVVAIDEKTGHPDLASDRQTLENARKMAAHPPEARPGRAAPPQAAPPQAENDLDDAKIQAQLESLPPDQRPQAEAARRSPNSKA